MGFAIRRSQVRVPLWGLYLESPSNFFVFVVFSFKKLSVNEAKLTGVWARNCANIQQVLILKFAFGPEEFSSLSRSGPLATCWICSRKPRVQFFGRSCKQPTGGLLPFVVFDPVMFYFIILFSTELFEWNACKLAG